MTKQMKDRFFRVFMGYVFPIFIMGCTFGMYFNRSNYIKDYIVTFLLRVHVFEAFSILFFSIPIVIYSCLMEFVINPKLVNGYWAVFISTILVAIVIFSAFNFNEYKYSLGQRPFQGSGQYILLLIGLGIGLLSSLWLRFIYIRQKNEQPLSASVLCINALTILSFITSTIFIVVVFGR